MNKDKRSANLIAVMLLTIMLSFPKEMKAQFAFDYTSIEAYISDHKSVRSLLMTRATLEYGNQLLHEYSQEKTEGYKDLNFELDRYTRAFDIIDIMYQSLRLGLNIYSTYVKVSERLYGYGDMLDRYNELVLKRGKPELADKRLLTINYEAIKKISAECDDLYKSVYDLILYATGAAACSTENFSCFRRIFRTHIRICTAAGKRRSRSLQALRPTHPFGKRHKKRGCIFRRR